MTDYKLNRNSSYNDNFLSESQLEILMHDDRVNVRRNKLRKKMGKGLIITKTVKDIHGNICPFKINLLEEELIPKK